MCGNLKGECRISLVRPTDESQDSTQLLLCILSWKLFFRVCELSDDDDGHSRFVGLLPFGAHMAIVRYDAKDQEGGPKGVMDFEYEYLSKRLTGTKTAKRMWASKSVD